MYGIPDESGLLKINQVDMSSHRNTMTDDLLTGF